MEEGRGRETRGLQRDKGDMGKREVDVQEDKGSGEEGYTHEGQGNVDTGTQMEREDRGYVQGYIHYHIEDGS